MKKKTEIKIEKGIPIPKRLSGYPLHEMEVGDSFEFPSEQATNVNTQIQNYKRSNNGKFTVRKYTENTHRCWRIE